MWALCRLARRQMLASMLILRNAVAQDLREEVRTQSIRNPEALSVHVDDAAVGKDQGMPPCYRFAVEFVGSAIHVLLMAGRKQDLVRHNDGQDWLSANHGYQNETFRILILMDGNIGVAPFFHDIEACANDFTAMAEVPAFRALHGDHLNLECFLMMRVTRPKAMPCSISTLRTRKLTVSSLAGISLVR